MTNPYQPVQQINNPYAQHYTPMYMPPNIQTPYNPALYNPLYYPQYRPSHYAQPYAQPYGQLYGQLYGQHHSQPYGQIHGQPNSLPYGQPYSQQPNPYQTTPTYNNQQQSSPYQNSGQTYTTPYGLPPSGHYDNNNKK